ncbi:MAG: beta-galactosidase [Bacteroidaceae bacterium]|nr:beta-galactosidase [Bacteroidaceae bacterium]
MRKTLLLMLLAVAMLLGSCAKREKHTFEVKDGKFLYDGEKVQLICGEMHYPRIPVEYWRDRMQRAKAMGLNTISAYVFWAVHEPQPGEFNFEGQADIARFVEIAAEEGLFVLLRPGPYVCAEFDFGGYPYWLQNDSSLVWRSDNPAFLAACERYLNALGKELAPHTVTNGGNIIMVQVENEYGSYSNDKVYLGKMAELIKNAGFNVPLMTCDGSGQMPNGYIPGILPTVNGAVGDDIMRSIDRFWPGGPYFVAEFYPAWFDVWGLPHSAVNYQRPAEQLDWMLKNDVSISIYMFHGGTNFHYTNGANTNNGSYEPQPTSYDYDAPLGEYGNAYPKYHAFREVIQRNLPEGKVLPPVPADNPTTTFAPVELTEWAPLSVAYGKSVEAEKPQTFEAMMQDYGYLYYQTNIATPDSGKLVLDELRDYAVVILNGEVVGSIDRRFHQNSIPLNVTEPNSVLGILVENGGRVNYGKDLVNNLKGITKRVVFNGNELTGWTTTSLPLHRTDVSKFKFPKMRYEGNLPGFYRGTFTIDKVGDTFVDMTGWGKGAVWVNGKSLGKFWGIGPQQTMYLPAPWLKKGENEIVVFEMEYTGKRTLCGVDKPILDVLGPDKNAFKTSRQYNRVPILDEFDGIFKGQVEKKTGWQEFTFDGIKTLRHLCIDIQSTYDGTNSCICEVELLDENGNAIDKNKWEIVHVNTEALGEGLAEDIIDGDEGTYWHSAWKRDVKALPHQVIIDLGNIRTVKGFRICMRDVNKPGCIKDFRLYGRPQFFLYE